MSAALITFAIPTNSSDGKESDPRLLEVPAATSLHVKFIYNKSGELIATQRTPSAAAASPNRSAASPNRSAAAIIKSVSPMQESDSPVPKKECNMQQSPAPMQQSSSPMQQSASSTPTPMQQSATPSPTDSTVPNGAATDSKTASLQTFTLPETDGPTAWKDALDVRTVRTAAQRVLIEQEAVHRRSLFHPEMAAYWKTHWDAKCDAQSLALKKQIPELMKLPVGERVDRHLIKIERVPDAPGVPKGLVGQWGIYAAVKIERDTAIGVYEGKLTVCPGGNCNNLCYGMPVPTADGKAKEKDFRVDPWEPFGNGVLERINDYRRDVTRAACSAKNPLIRRNVETSEVFYNGEAFLVTHSCRTIEIGDELFLNYGNGYWKFRAPQNSDCCSSNCQQKLLDGRITD